MKLLVKFSVIYVLVFGLGLGAAAFVFYGQLQRSAREQVLYHAQIIMETALAMRNYTVAQVRPAFGDANRREDDVAAGFQEVCARRAVMKSAQERRSAVERAAAEKAAAAGKPAGDQAATGRVVTAAREDLTPDPFRDICERKGPAARVFRPQTVPAFAATEIFNFLSKKYPEYAYKEATLNPTNPRDRAVDWEEDIIKAFRNRPELTAFDGERNSALGRSLFLARPMRAAKACLECHSTPAAAPSDMIALYGTSNGFGWKEDEIIAAQIVSVPTSVSVAMADRAFRQLVTSLVVVAGLTLIFLNLVLFLTVIRPVSRFAAMADEISTGNLDVPELEVQGSDEISLLAAAFNRMHRSLTTAMRLLDKQ
jgi:HAMP domain-containing protein